ncbi:type I-E CRISPR-associated protein Cse1/CasA [Corynebacterium diphtheriae]|uniref:type I-E CRISPR-associated protein Cse1/CasA n=1 Tax=Corynebacterium diphtheriae TaxID=1717 RepID=UPI000245B83D|nr:type I-E CRISPR-associated protein Cse1/CasA [Corynebacterium diphtheriae]AEX45347.1 CRISPR-associated protein [Corynebacterium diphtheriae INCA 402]MBG9222436.1 type I-E CRISPR-associated protein Cse1/CasA [Corynebacterium diphtheriae bv. mitis]MBG9301875.1 type I-E CRISPR-associated protein Cse1/CasA [Corynebacterium diphtheriae bv. mitis]OJI00752.1 type I-E CRISPR-associated protein Cse1/CasA [Corynebacterium diphtheriae]OSQ09065.1 type I-E CRISPR-associated protein Cse1/CasA [Corynebact
MASLLEIRWILALDTQGNQISVGIRDIFAGEVQVAYIQGESPAQDYAVMRLLLAIFWRAHSMDIDMDVEPFDFLEWFNKMRRRLARKGKDQVVLDYLDRYADRFELFDVKAPFMQVAGLHVASGEYKHITTIIPEAQDEYFSMRGGKERDSVSTEEAARWLVYVQAFDYNGIKSGAVGDSRVKGGRGYPIGTGWTGMTGGTLVKGEDLLDTLLLNTTLETLNDPEDRPVWERTVYGPDERAVVGENSQPQGPADLATWQSRRIRLIPEGDRVVGVIVCNGDKIPDAGANVLDDPMTPYRFSANKSKKDHDVYYPRPYDVERTMWKALDALVVAETDGGFSAKEKAPKRPKNLASLAELAVQKANVPAVLNVDLVSVEYGPHASSVATTYASRMSIPVVLLLTEAKHLRGKVREIARATTQSAVALGQFSGNLLDAAGGEYAFQPAITDRVLAELEPRFNDWLERLRDISPEQAIQDNESLTDLEKVWQHTARSIIDQHARILLRGAGPKALAGRIQYRDADDHKGRVVSAAGYYRMLQRKLDEVLPLTVRKQEKEGE